MRACADCGCPNSSVLLASAGQRESKPTPFFFQTLTCVCAFDRGARYAIILSHDDPEDPQAPYADAVVGNVCLHLISRRLSNRLTGPAYQQHPSFVEVPKEIQAVRRPLWINVGSADSVSFPPHEPNNLCRAEF